MQEPKIQFKHRIVQALYELIEEWGNAKVGITLDPRMMMFKALWMALRAELPSMLKSLDENEEACALIREKIKKVLEDEEIEQYVVKEDIGIETSMPKDITSSALHNEDMKEEGQDGTAD